MPSGENKTPSGGLLSKLVNCDCYLLIDTVFAICGKLEYPHITVEFKLVFKVGVSGSLTTLG